MACDDLRSKQVRSGRHAEVQFAAARNGDGSADARGLRPASLSLSLRRAARARDAARVRARALLQDPSLRRAGLGAPEFRAQGTGWRAAKSKHEMPDPDGDGR